MSDFLFTYTDRHLLNLGVLRDPDTLQFVKPAPLFDTGNSMFHNMRYTSDTVLDIPITSLYKAERKFLESVKDRSAFDLNNILEPDELDLFYQDDPYSVVYLDNVKEGYKKKIELLDAFQKGYSLNPRSAKFYQIAMSQTELDNNIELGE